MGADNVAVSAGNDPLGRPFRADFHVRADSDLLAALDAAA